MRDCHHDCICHDAHADVRGLCESYGDVHRERHGASAERAGRRRRFDDALYSGPAKLAAVNRTSILGLFNDSDVVYLSRPGTRTFFVRCDETCPPLPPDLAPNRTEATRNITQYAAFNLGANDNPGRLGAWKVEVVDASASQIRLVADSGLFLRRSTYQLSSALNWNYTVAAVDAVSPTPTPSSRWSPTTTTPAPSTCVLTMAIARGAGRLRSSLERQRDGGGCV